MLYDYQCCVTTNAVRLPMREGGQVSIKVGIYSLLTSLLDGAVATTAKSIHMHLSPLCLLRDIFKVSPEPPFLLSVPFILCAFLSVPFSVPCFMPESLCFNFSTFLFLPFSLCLPLSPVAHSTGPCGNLEWLAPACRSRLLEQSDCLTIITTPKQTFLAVPDALSPLQRSLSGFRCPRART